MLTYCNRQKFGTKFKNCQVFFPSFLQAERRARKKKQLWRRNCCVLAKTFQPNHRCFCRNELQTTPKCAKHRKIIKYICTIWNKVRYTTLKAFNFYFVYEHFFFKIIVRPVRLSKDGLAQFFNLFPKHVIQFTKAGVEFKYWHFKTSQLNMTFLSMNPVYIQSSFILHRHKKSNKVKSLI